MKRLILLIIVLCFLLIGCGSASDNATNETESESQEATIEQVEKIESNLYETLKLETVELGDIEFKIPSVFKDDIKESEGKTYYYYNDLMLLASCEQKNITNEEFVDGIDIFLEGMLQNNDSEITGKVLEQGVVELPIGKAIKAKIEKQYIIYILAFMYKDNLYGLGFAVEKQSETDYSQDFERLLESIDKKNTVEIIDKFLHNYDDNNSVEVSIAQDKETGKLLVIATGKYEEKNLALMQFDSLTIKFYPILKKIDLMLMETAGENSYSCIYTGGRLLSDDIPTETGEIADEYNEQIKEVMKGIEDLYIKYEIAEKIYNTLVHEDEKVKIYFSGIVKNGVEFTVENLTDVNITLQADSVSINGISTNDIIMSDDVAPKSKGKVIARCDDFSTETKVETIGGQLRIIDFDNGVKTYKATFANVPIE